MKKTLQIHPNDNVAVALATLDAGDAAAGGIAAAERIMTGHKLSLRPIAKGEAVIKYGAVIGEAAMDIPAGAWVHTHNIRSRLGNRNILPPPEGFCPPALPTLSVGGSEQDCFQGFLRSDGGAATRNELWILPLVGCVNGIAAGLARENAHLVRGSIEGLYSFPHPFGCSQLGEDHEATRRILAALARHPNAGGVLIVGLGCENLTFEQFQAELGQFDTARIRFLHCQDSADEREEGARLLRELAEHAGRFSRSALPASRLIAGLKCGGSDGLSGITANPAAGVFSDRLCAIGGSAILTETPEMFGAEQLLFSRCRDKDVYTRAVRMTESFQEYYRSHGQPVYENPSPGNKEGGISTLEDKSCGCVQKGGLSPVTDVLRYGDTVRERGLNLLDGPGNDLVSATALTAAGAQLILFTTGRGTPFGAPVPTLKIATNSPLFEHKRRWTDFNAGTVAQGESIQDAGERLYRHVLRVASGEQTENEKNGYREISIWKNGVVL